MDKRSTGGKLMAGGSDASQTGLVALLFTDIVQSTALKQTLGDQSGAALVDQHHALVREVLRAFRDGEEIETAGDSFLILFTKPSSSVHFALALQSRLREWNRGIPFPVQDRVGIHSGEIVIRPRDERAKSKRLAGLQVDLAARVMSLAQGGQILLTRAVFDSARQALKGEDLPGVNALTWLNHGPYLLKGIEDPVEVCEVAEAGQGTLPAPVTSEKARRQIDLENESVLGWRPAVGLRVPNTRWILERPLGEGGFGEVWLGRHEAMKERRVFKFCFHADRVRSLKREMTLFRLIKERIGDHPNIVGLREVYFDHPPFYLEMDYVAGRDLRTWCEAQGGVGNIPLALKLEILAQAADGLQAAHDAGVIHRDVKPGNILVAESGLVVDGNVQGETGTPTSSSSSRVRIKLTDFGIGQVLSEECLGGVTKAGFTATVLSSSSAQSGTQLYMAPELLAGKPGSIRSDIYSLGVVAYQLLVGNFTTPVTGDWADQVHDPLLRDDLKHCLAGHTEARFSGAGQLARSLRSWEERRAEAARQERLLRQGERRRKLLLASGAGALAMLMLSLALGYGMRQAQIERDYQRQLAYAADMRAADAALQEGNIGQVSHRLERYLPRHGQEDLRGLEWSYLWQSSRSEDAGGFLYPAIPSCGDVSSDGRWIATSGLDGWIRVHDMEGNEALRHRSGAAKDALWERNVVFSPRNDWLAVATRTNVLIWDTKNWQLRRSLPFEGAWRVFSSPDGQRLGVIGGQFRLQVWSTQNWQTDAAPEECPVLSVLNGIFSPDNCTLALVSNEGPRQLIFWDLAHRSQLRTNTAIPKLRELAISPDNQRLATVTYDWQVAVWDLATGGLLAELPERVRYTQTLAFSPDSQILATAGADQLVHLWQVGTTNELRRFKGHSLEIWWGRFSADGRWLYTGSEDRTVRRWPVAALAPKAPVIQLTGKRELLDLRDDGARALMFSHPDQQLEEWDATHCLRQVRLEALPSSDNTYTEVRFDPPLLLALGTSGGGVFDPETGQRTFPDRSNTNAFLPACVSGDGRWVVGTERVGDGWIGGVWGLKDKNRWRSIPDLGPDRFLTGTASFSRDGRWLAYQTTNYQIGLCELTKGHTRYYPGHMRPIFTLCFSPNGKHLASASWDATARVWEVASGRAVTPWLVGHRSGVAAAQFSADGRTLTTASNDSRFRFWNVPTGTEVLEGRSHTDFLRRPLSSDSSVLMEGWETNAVRFTRLVPLADIDTQIRSHRLISVGPVGP